MIGHLTAERESEVTARTGTFGMANALRVAREDISREIALRIDLESEVDPTHHLQDRGLQDQAEATTRNLQEEIERELEAKATTDQDEGTDQPTRRETENVLKAPRAQGEAESANLTRSQLKDQRARVCMLNL